MIAGVPLELLFISCTSTKYPSLRKLSPWPARQQVECWAHAVCHVLLAGSRSLSIVARVVVACARLGENPFSATRLSVAMICAPAPLSRNRIEKIRPPLIWPGGGGSIAETAVRLKGILADVELMVGRISAELSLLRAILATSLSSIVPVDPIAVQSACITAAADMKVKIITIVRTRYDMVRPQRASSCKQRTSTHVCEPWKLAVADRTDPRKS